MSPGGFVVGRVSVVVFGYACELRVDLQHVYEAATLEAQLLHASLGGVFVYVSSLGLFV